MRNRAIVAAALLTVVVTACGSAEQPEVVEQIVVREPGEAAVPVAASADAAGAVDMVALGEDAFQMCTGCHSVEDGAPSAAGPNLHGVFGRGAAKVEDFAYSDALAQSDITWNYETLDLYLANPAGYVPGTEMAAGAVRDGDARAAIVAYLVANSPEAPAE